MTLEAYILSNDTTPKAIFSFDSDNHPIPKTASTSKSVSNEVFNCGEYVVVAFTDTWYPGVITEINNGSATISFMHWYCVSQYKLKWPDVVDSKTIPFTDVLTKCQPPTICSKSSFRGDQYDFNKKEFDRICQMYDKSN